MDKKEYSNYILNLVKNKGVNPGKLLEETRDILENYVNSITDTTEIPILYNTSYGGFSFSKRFVNYLKQEKILDFKKLDTEKVEEDSQFDEDDDMWDISIWEIYDDRAKWYKHIIDFGRKLITGNKEGYNEYLKLKYRYDLISKHLNQCDIFVKRDQVYSENLEILQDYLKKNEFGTDDIDFCFLTLEIDRKQLRTKTENVLRKAIIYLESEKVKEKKFKFKEQWLQYMDNDEILFEKLCDLIKEKEDWEKNGFDIDTMMWYDPITRTLQSIDETILKKVIETIGLQAASGQYSKLQVCWITGNKGYEITEHDGYERVHELSVLCSEKMSNWNVSNLK